MKYLLTSQTVQRERELELDLKDFARRCLRCHKSYKKQHRGVEFFESMRHSYIKRNKLNTLQAIGVSEIVRGRKHTERLHRANSLPVVTVGLAVCGRGVDDIESYLLLSAVFPAYAMYLESSYQYWFILGADVGDPIFDNERRRNVVERRFNETIGTAGN